MRGNGLVPFGFESRFPFFFDDFDFPVKRGVVPKNWGFNALKSDVKETDTSYIVEAELPGYEKEDIQVVMEDGILSISAKTHSEKNEDKDGYIVRERYSGSYSRKYSFENVDADAIKAKYDKGVLTVELPKVKKPAEKKGITVE